MRPLSNLFLVLQLTPEIITYYPIFVELFVIKVTVLVTTMKNSFDPD